MVKPPVNKIDHKKAKIVHITTVHKRKDTRIFQKELRSLSLFFNDVTLIVNDCQGNEIANDIHIVDLNIPVKTRFQRFMKPFYALLKTVYRLKPDIVHFHDPELLLSGILFSLFGCSVIYDAHEDVPKQIMEKRWIPAVLRRIVAVFFSCFERFSVLFFKGIIFVIESQQQRLGFKNNIVLHNFPVALGYPDDVMSALGLNFIHTGTLTDFRGLQEMLDALELLPEGCNLLLAGILPPEALEYAEKHSAWPRVQYLGWLDSKELVKTTRGAIAGLILFHPLSSMIHCSPNKLFEYMASGIPVIASSSSGFSKIVQSAQCGLLVDPQDYLSVYKAMLYLLENPEERTRMGNNGLRAIKEHYNWEKESVKLIELYNNILLKNKLKEAVR